MFIREASLKILSTFPEKENISTLKIIDLLGEQRGIELSEKEKWNVRVCLQGLEKRKYVKKTGKARYTLLIPFDKLKKPEPRKRNMINTTDLRPIEKQALDWYPNANYGRILDLLDELGYKHIPSPITELKDVVRIYLHYVKKRAVKEK